MRRDVTIRIEYQTMISSIKRWECSGRKIKIKNKTLRMKNEK